jgi:hypothetical protein
MRRLHALLNQTGMMDSKVELVQDISNGRTSSSKELNVDEAKVLIGQLERMLPTKQDAYLPDEDPIQKRRRKVFALFAEMGYIYGQTADDRKINQAVVYRMVREHGVCKPNELNAYKADELLKLVNQLSSWKKNNEMSAISKQLRKELAEMGLTY